VSDFSAIPVAAVTAAITTIVTLAATKVVSLIGERVRRERHRLVMRRGAGHSYALTNVSRRPLLDVGITVIRDANTQPGYVYGVALSALGGTYSDISLQVDDIVQINWSETGWLGKTKYRQSRSVRITEQDEHYYFKNDRDVVPIAMGHEGSILYSG